MADQFSGTNCETHNTPMLMGEQGEYCEMCDAKRCHITKLELGRVVVTPAALELLNRNGAAFSQIADLLDRYVSGDWGVLDAEDMAQNNAACSAEDPQRVLANYPVTGGDGSASDDGRIWIITEWDRSVTTILLPDDY